MSVRSDCSTKNIGVYETVCEGVGLVVGVRGRRTGGEGADGGREPGDQPGEYDGAGVFRCGDEFVVCGGGDPGVDWSGSRVFEVDAWGS